MKKLCVSLFLIAMLNFAIFFVVALLIGGDAVNGKTENGKYFVAEHGQYTEVSKIVFTYSRFHVFSVWITHPIGILAAGVLAAIERRKKK